MDLKKILDEELKKRDDEDILSGRRFFPSASGLPFSYDVPGDYSLPPSRADAVLPSYLALPSEKPKAGSKAGLLGHLQQPSGYLSAYPSAGSLMQPSKQSYFGSPAQNLPKGSLPQQYGLPGMPSEQLSVSYTGSNGTMIQMSAVYNTANKSQAVGTLMSALYGSVMGSYQGASTGSKGRKN